MSDDRDEPPNAEEADATRDARKGARAALPAPYVDTWATSTWKGHIRVVVGEWITDDPNYRSAFVMELEDARRFAEHILRRVLSRQEKDAELAGERQETTSGS